ncbi:MAG TPA: DNA-directed RNA polymerase subunit A', partial [Candidatus Thermoplasmatota archaeon]|nr:DNA-directed RNA polymerase subunit A' [Candidatus Thermoplasmatota archaeon]
EARAEARILMRVQEHILSPRFGGPIIGAIHDEITGAFLLTFRDVLFEKSKALSILSKVGITKLRGEPAKVEERDGRKVELWSGKQIFAHVLPEDLSLAFSPEIREGQVCAEDGKSVEECEYGGMTVIRKGVLIHGPIDEKAIGAFKGEILNKIMRKYGANAGRAFIDDVTKLCIGAITMRGFSTGIDDEDIPREAQDQISNMLDEAMRKVESLVRAFHEGQLEQMPGRSLDETLELEIMQVLGRARDQAGQIAGRYLGLDNSAVIMAKSGARGSMLNLSQMAGSVGQQAVRGERIRRGYQQRTLPHFKRGDLGAFAKGFVKSCYKSGLNPTEYFFHSMGGREGLVDTAVRTSRSGYMQRRLINALEDLKIEYDGTVRNTAGTIIQFDYGEDRVDPTRSLRGKAVNVNEAIMEVLGVDVGPERTTRGKSTYDREDVELTRSMLDEMSETDEDVDYGGE